VRGPTLKDLIVARQLEGARTLRILKPIAQALDAAHEVDLIHRDIKPQNILVGLHDHPYLADFGLTKGANEVGLTRTGQFVGTTDYIAPEQIRGEAASAASDVYSLAGVLYECLTGVVPYAKPSDAAVLFAHMMESPPLVTDQRPDLPAALDEVIARGMAKDPAARQARASDLVNEAERAFGRRIRAAITPPGPLEVPEETGIRFPEQKIATHQTRIRPVPEPVEESLAPPATNEEADAPAPEPMSPATAPAPLREAPPLREADSTAAAAHADVVAFPPAPDTRLSPPVAPTRPTPLAPRRAREDTPATVLARPARVPAGPSSRDEPRSRVPLALVAAVAILAVAAGLLIGGRGDSSPAPARPAPPLANSASGDVLDLSFPTTWRRTTRPPPIEGLDLARPVALGAPTRGAGIVAGRTTAAGPTLLPAAFLERLADRPAAERVRLGAVQALRYRGLRPGGSGPALTVFAVPTSRGVATLACHAPAAAAAAFQADCERVAASLKLSGAKAYALGPQAGYARGADRALTALARARARGRRALARARTQGGQSRLAGALATDHDRAADALARLAVSPADATAHAALVAAIRRARDGYARMARAARHHDAKGFQAGEGAVRDGDEKLRRALPALDDLGYEIG
jgi:serine/threonine-protein kinase